MPKKSPKAKSGTVGKCGYCEGTGRDENGKCTVCKGKGWVRV